MDLFSSPQGLYSFTLHTRYGISPSEIIAFIEEYDTSGVISMDENQRITLTSKGKELISGLITGVKEQVIHDSDYICAISAPSIDYLQPYLPKIDVCEKLLSKESNKETSN
ncbi:MAG: hypothetical protein MJY97_00125 [Bacteroidales bacterium]|nr:hypothetical protein [Bacteroidales bacterium]